MCNVLSTMFTNVNNVVQISSRTSYKSFFYNKMKKKNYHTFRKIPNANIKIVESIINTLTHKYMTVHSFDLE